MSDLGQPQPTPQQPMQPMQPGMMVNPAFVEWAQQAQAWTTEKQKRQQDFESACALIKSDAAKRFKIDIEADSTIAADEQAEKQARTEFLTAITPFLETVVPGMMANPALAPLGKEIGMFAVRAFKVSRQLEDAFETAFDALLQQAKTNPHPPTPPGKGGATKSPIEIQAEAAEAQGKNQVEQQANQVKLAQVQTDAQIERERMAMQQQNEAAQLAMHGREIEGRERLEDARMQHMAARDIQGMV